jgi:hypothetical protein
MPSATQINEGLARIATDAVAAALLWHGLFLLAGLALLQGWRPSRRGAAALLTLPLFSVGALAWWYANPFNAAVFTMLAGGLAAGASRLASAPVRRGPPWTFVVGAAMVAFGWTYPHFLEPGTRLRYLIAAPTGIVPCPTLAIVIGFALVGDALRSTAWAMPLAVVGVFYALFGTFRLGVGMDLFLLIGAVALLWRAAGQRLMSGVAS